MFHSRRFTRLSFIQFDLFYSLCIHYCNNKYIYWIIRSVHRQKSNRYRYTFKPITLHTTCTSRTTFIRYSPYQTKRLRWQLNNEKFIPYRRLYKAPTWKMRINVNTNGLIYNKTIHFTKNTYGKHEPTKITEPQASALGQVHKFVTWLVMIVSALLFP